MKTKKRSGNLRYRLDGSIAERENALNNLNREVTKGPLQVKPTDPNFVTTQHLVDQLLTPEEFQTQCKTRIAQAIVTRLGIKEGDVIFHQPKINSVGTQSTVWAIEVSIKPEGSNRGLFTYRGPWGPIYERALMLALEEVEQTLDFLGQK